jgi:hypothetical protein
MVCLFLAKIKEYIMSHEHKLAIEKIIALSEKSRIPTQRGLRIYDIALESMGLTRGQRIEEIRKLPGGIVQGYVGRMEAERENSHHRFLSTKKGVSNEVSY